MANSQPSQADIIAALQAQASSSRKQKPETTPYTAHAHPFSALTTQEVQARNSRKLYCPREGCGSLILLAETAQWHPAPGDLIPTEAGSPFTPTAPHPVSEPPNETVDGQAAYWHITGGPMAFENVGYSRPSDKSLPPSAPGMASGKKVKWLICADCDLGPIGWSFEGGSESWLDVGRVRYGP